MHPYVSPFDIFINQREAQQRDEGWLGACVVGGGASVSEIAPTCEHERRRKRRNPFVLPLLMCGGRTREPRAARTRPGPLREREQKRGTEQRRRKHEMRDGHAIRMESA